MEQPSEAIRRGVDALDFLPLGLNVKAARPPQDADGLEAMYAALALHKMLSVYRRSSPAAAEAWTAHEIFVKAEKASPHAESLAPLLERYREALTAALAVSAADPAELRDLIDWYKQDLKRID